MKRIKLDAIDSTNDYLKSLCFSQTLENFTIVTAQYQLNGKGQMGAKWDSESSKNLITSILIKNTLQSSNEIFDLNVVVTLAVVSALKKYKIPNLSIKWPNDIMADNKKIGGILIENTFKSNSEIISIVGIGLNVNQTNFDNLPNASSLKIEMNSDFDIEKLLANIIEDIKINVSVLKSGLVENLWLQYNKKLFMKGVNTSFATATGEIFSGIIQGVSPFGQLIVLLNNQTVKYFRIKEIQMLY